MMMQRSVICVTKVGRARGLGMLKKRRCRVRPSSAIQPVWAASGVYCFDDLLDEFHQPHAVFLFELLLQSIGSAA
jgi:hypothetical protein